MRKIDELSDPNSCLNKANDDEMVFVLVAHDYQAASDAIRAWVASRILYGKNRPEDPKILSAMAVADRMMIEGPWVTR